MDYIKTEDQLPEAHPLNGSNAPYYFIHIENYVPAIAMYLVDENGEKAWYKDYTAKIIKPVIRWAK